MSLPIWSLRLSTRSGVSGSDLLRALSEVSDPRACRDVWALDVHDLGGAVVCGRPTAIGEWAANASPRVAAVAGRGC